MRWDEIFLAPADRTCMHINSTVTRDFSDPIGNTNLKTPDTAAHIQKPAPALQAAVSDEPISFGSGRGEKLRFGPKMRTAKPQVSGRQVPALVANRPGSKEITQALQQSEKTTHVELRSAETPKVPTD